MERIIPVAGATGMHSYAPTEVDPRLLNDQDEDSVHATSQAPAYEDMDVDAIGEPSQAVSVSAAIISTSGAAASTSAIPSPNIPRRPVAKRQRSLDYSDTSKPRGEAEISVPSERSKKSKLSLSQKGKGKAKT